MHPYCLLCFTNRSDAVSDAMHKQHLTDIFLLMYLRCTLVQNLQQLLFASSTTAQPILTPWVQFYSYNYNLQFSIIFL